ncbi:GntR family transcriptional regulator [Streptomyces sp. 846.5]|nr:GntR family transcriptional regulator [Streptomyces sp. 846.5]TDU04179.1 GntR family transcriptional regulator [Streptomyces sp. 846.5]
MAQDEQRPEYARIAAELRAGILDGRYPPGSQLPTLPELEQQYGVSLTTVRNALGLLRNEGLIESRTRAGHRVRELRPVHRVTAERYRRAETPSDLGAEWTERHIQTRFEKVPADAGLADLFGCPVGSELLARHFVFHSAGQPVQMSTSYLRWDDVAGTPVADPINEPWPGGTIAQFASLGTAVVRVEESLTAAMPTEREAEVLRIGPGVPVLRWTRRMLAADGRVVEVARPIVRRADNTVVDTAVDLA